MGKTMARTIRKKEELKYKESLRLIHQNLF
jgi:hypothetical protein